MPAAFISHSDCGRHDTGWGHPEHVGRLRAITRSLRKEPDLFHAVSQIEGRHATPDELALVHGRDYIRSIQVTAAAGGGRLDTDTVTSEGSWDAGAAGAGSALQAVDLCVTGTCSRSFVAVRPPGHHALATRSMGFCLFGNVALAARYARTVQRLERVLIIDWDVHHGNGTQALVEEDSGIRFVSMHQWPWYPGTGGADDRGPHGNVWNIPMPAGLPRDNYVSALLAGVDAASAGFKPDMILVSAGFDSLAGDPLGGFTMEVEDFEKITDEIVARSNVWCAGRVVSVLEGGYAPDKVATAVIAHLRRLAV